MRSAPSSVTTGGQTYRASDAYVWSDLMPGAPGQGRCTLHARAKVTAGGGDTKDLAIDRVWVLTSSAPYEWRPGDGETDYAQRSAGPGAIEVVTARGPKLADGTRVTVVLRIRVDGSTHLLRLPATTTEDVY